MPPYLHKTFIEYTKTTIKQTKIKKLKLYRMNFFYENQNRDK